MRHEGTPFGFDDLAMPKRTRTTTSKMRPLKHEVAIGHVDSNPVGHPPATLARVREPTWQKYQVQRPDLAQFCAELAMVGL